MTISVILIPYDESKPLENPLVSWDEDHAKNFQNTICELLDETDFLETPLMRPRGNNVAGLYAYYNNNNNTQNENTSSDNHNNIRATRLAMACGLLPKRFQGRVLIVRSFGGTWQDLTIDEIVGACCVSMDLRSSIQMELGKSNGIPPPPTWLADAAQHNYHDGAALAQVATAMNMESKDDDDDDDEDDSSNSSNEEEKDSSTTKHNKARQEPAAATAITPPKEFITKIPLCLHCRRPSSCLCEGCHGAYFCKFPRRCRTIGWSHDCLCPTWKLYDSHRHHLSTFPDNCFGDWQTRLIGRDFQTQERPYEHFLKELGITNENRSWWRTEMHGWAGGKSKSANDVDASIRRSYVDGFAPISDIPPEQRVSAQELERANISTDPDLGLPKVTSWNDYYRLRNLSRESPIALLCTFPLTIYYAIERFGKVPVTVAKMLKRPLRVHVVGAEKEMNFLDLFKEVAFLLPEDCKVRAKDFSSFWCLSNSRVSLHILVLLSAGISVCCSSGHVTGEMPLILYTKRRPVFLQGGNDYQSYHRCRKWYLWGPFLSRSKFRYRIGSPGYGDCTECWSVRLRELEKCCGLLVSAFGSCRSFHGL